jgi:hypothetical protein
MDRALVYLIQIWLAAAVLLASSKSECILIASTRFVTDRNRIYILCVSDHLVANMILACFDLLYCSLGLNANLASRAVSYMIAPSVHLHLVLPAIR